MAQKKKASKKISKVKELERIIELLIASENVKIEKVEQARKLALSLK